MFIAQDAGIYHFTLFIRSDPDATSDPFNILKNGDIQCTSYTEGEDAEAVEIYATCAATMELVPGDEVYVSCIDTNAIDGDENSGFTGFLTKPYM